MSAATYEDVAVAIGRPITDPGEQAQVEYWLTSAELIIGSRLGDVALLDPAVLKFVEVEAVAARVQNPEGYASETVDDYTYRLPAESRRVTILPEWWDMLTPAGSSDAFSIRAYGATDVVEPDLWTSTTEHL